MKVKSKRPQTIVISGSRISPTWLSCSRYVGMILGTVTAGKLADRTNQHILHAFALLLMGVTLVSASMCHTLVVFSIIIGVQGFFNGIHSVGKETTKRISSGYSGWGGGAKT